jgi:hypothetical protein
LNDIAVVEGIVGNVAVDIVVAVMTSFVINGHKSELNVVKQCGLWIKLE